MKQCTKCGKQMDDDSFYCSDCKTILDTKEDSKSATIKGVISLLFLLLFLLGIIFLSVKYVNCIMNFGCNNKNLIVIAEIISVVFYLIGLIIVLAGRTEHPDNILLKVIMWFYIGITIGVIMLGCVMHIVVMPLVSCITFPWGSDIE